MNYHHDSAYPVWKKKPIEKLNNRRKHDARTI